MATTIPSKSSPKWEHCIISIYALPHSSQPQPFSLPPRHVPFMLAQIPNYFTVRTVNGIPLLNVKLNVTSTFPVMSQDNLNTTIAIPYHPGVFQLQPPHLSFDPIQSQHVTPIIDSMDVDNHLQKYHSPPNNANLDTPNNLPTKLGLGESDYTTFMQSKLPKTNQSGAKKSIGTAINRKKRVKFNDSAVVSATLPTQAKKSINLTPIKDNEFLDEQDDVISDEDETSLDYDVLWMSSTPFPKISGPDCSSLKYNSQQLLLIQYLLRQDRDAEHPDPPLVEIKNYCKICDIVLVTFHYKSNDTTIWMPHGLFSMNGLWMRQINEYVQQNQERLDAALKFRNLAETHSHCSTI
jgi:hypothetical protein